MFISPPESALITRTPAVSVIVPCYRVTEYVTAALDSLRAQTFRDFETILVNDGCPDTPNLERALHPYRDEIVYIRQENQGVSAARNAGIRAASAPLIALLDGDDEWEPQYLERHVSLLHADPMIDAVYPNALLIGNNPWAGRFLMDIYPSRGEVTFAKVVKQTCTVFSCLTARRASMERGGLFDPSLQSAEDMDLWLRMLNTGAKFTYRSEPLVRHRLRRGSLSLGDDQTSMAHTTLRMFGKLLSTLALSDEDRQALVEEIARVNAAMNVIHARRALYRRNASEALRQFARANRVLKQWRLAVAIGILRVWPGLLSAYVHRKFPAEELYVR